MARQNHQVREVPSRSCSRDGCELRENQLIGHDAVRSLSPGPQRTCQDAPLLTRMEPIHREREQAGGRQCADKRMQNRGDFLNGKTQNGDSSKGLKSIAHEVQTHAMLI